jgi:hypothetical protein
MEKEEKGEERVDKIGLFFFFLLRNIKWRRWLKMG